MRYSGTDELRVMELAVRYNSFLTASISSLVPPPGPILDFGAGLGSFAKRLRSQGYEIHCLEPDEFLANDLVQSGFQVYRSQDEIADNLYNAIYTLNVLEHIQHDREALSGLVSKLHAKGRLLIYVPAFPLLYSAFDAQVGHYRRYRLKQVTEMLQDLGCSIENRGYVDSLGFFLALLYKWLEELLFLFEGS